MIFSTTSRENAWSCVGVFVLFFPRHRWMFSCMTILQCLVRMQCPRVDNINRLTDSFMLTVQGFLPYCKAVTVHLHLPLDIGCRWGTTPISDYFEQSFSILFSLSSLSGFMLLVPPTHCVIDPPLLLSVHTWFIRGSFFPTLRSQFVSRRPYTR